MKLSSSAKVKCIPLRKSSKHFFPYCIDEWNKLNLDVRNVKSIYKFEN